MALEEDITSEDVSTNAGDADEGFRDRRSDCQRKTV